MYRIHPWVLMAFHSEHFCRELPPVQAASSCQERTPGKQNLESRAKSLCGSPLLNRAKSK